LVASICHKRVVVMLWVLWPIAALWFVYAVVGRRWRIEPQLADVLPPTRLHDAVVAVVPARNEAFELPQTLGALLAQTHPALRVVLVDDHSGDGTADVARRVAAAAHASDRLVVLSAPALPAGWTGKVWAQQHGVEHAHALGAAWVWLTDADIRHEPDVLARLLATAHHQRRDFVSVMARLRCRTGFEKLLIPAFTYFFAGLYPFHRIGSDRTRAAGAAGGCMLVRSSLLERIGGMSAIRDAVIDDVSLARVCKVAGGRLWLGYHQGVTSTRGYSSLSAIWHMVARSAYTQLRRNPVIVAGCVLGLVYTFLLPVALALAAKGPVRALGVATYVAMVRTYMPMVTWLGCRRLWALALPLSAVLYTMMTISSAWRHHRGAGAAWKGRAYGTLDRPPAPALAGDEDAR
jgi:hopene-associated glycosyltransferase HpnB